MYVLMSPHTRGSVTVQEAFHTHFTLTLIIQFHLYSFSQLDFVLILFSEPPVTVIKKLEDLRFPQPQAQRWGQEQGRAAYIHTAGGERSRRGEPDSHRVQ